MCAFGKIELNGPLSDYLLIRLLSVSASATGVDLLNTGLRVLSVTSGFILQPKLHQ